MSKSSTKQKLVLLQSILSSQRRKEQKKINVEKLNYKVIELQNRLKWASQA
jgi:hypothetical protein